MKQGRFELVVPTMQMKSEVLNYFEASYQDGATVINGAPFYEADMGFEAWMMNHVLPMSKNETVPEGFVPATQFFAVAPSGNVIGAMNIRHYLNESLRIRDGHIGYSIHPMLRRKGYAKEMLLQGIHYLKGIGVDEVLVTCAKENAASRNTALSAGGILETEILHHGETIQQIWIRT